MPMRNTVLTTPGQIYARPFEGPVDFFAQGVLDITALTAYEVDAQGYLVPGVLLKQGAPGVFSLIARPGATSSYVGTGNGGMTGLAVNAAAVEETFTITAITAASNGGTFRVVGSRSGVMANAVVGTAYDNGKIAFTIADGSSDYVVGDEFEVRLNGNFTFGVVPESIKVANGNTDAYLAAASAAFPIGIVTRAQVRRGIIEDNLGRALSAAEIAACSAAGSHITLIG